MYVKVVTKKKSTHLYMPYLGKEGSSNLTAQNKSALTM